MNSFVAFALILLLLFLITNLKSPFLFLFLYNLGLTICSVLKYLVFLLCMCPLRFIFCNRLRHISFFYLKNFKQIWSRLSYPTKVIFIVGILLCFIWKQNTLDELNWESTNNQDHALRSDSQQDVKIKSEDKSCVICGNGGKLLWVFHNLLYMSCFNLCFMFSADN